ncbi:hypothetical protein K492DRAFT_211561 [Lichtheimia hyalospora FSU 10163]|nr:hypothetical protein K492DRAFT_211561 [Lichtheimia hyalospora FSU 10163]
MSYNQQQPSGQGNYSGADINRTMHDQTYQSEYTGSQNEPLTQSSFNDNNNTTGFANNPTQRTSGGPYTAGNTAGVATGTAQPKSQTGYEQTQTSTAGQPQQRQSGWNQPSTADSYQNIGQPQQAERNPSAGERIKGNIEKLGGKLMNDPNKVAHGEDLAHGRRI